MQKNTKIFVAGHRGLVGSAVVRALQKAGYARILCAGREILDLADGAQTREFFQKERPEVVVLAAAKVGGIAANNAYRADFIAQNLAIQNNVLAAAHRFGVAKLLFLGSTCIYPKNAPNPITEAQLLAGPLEFTNEPYAVAKIAGLKMCEAYNLQYGTNFISAMPTNLYGPGDNFDLHTAHVLPALVRKMHLAKLWAAGDVAGVAQNLGVAAEAAAGVLAAHGVGADCVQIWGSGTPRREFLHVDDLAEACVFLLKKINFTDLCAAAGVGAHGAEVRNTHVNIGTGQDRSIKELAFLVRAVVGFAGDLAFDTTKPDGTAQKRICVARMARLGWRARIGFEEGLRALYAHYKTQKWGKKGKNGRQN